MSDTQQTNGETNGHAAETKPAPETNGHAAPETKPAPQTPTYKSLRHLADYPLVSSTLSTVAAMPLAQRTIALSSTAYTRFLAPLTPYLSPIEPYVSAADNLVDTNLAKIDERFPIVKEPTETVKERVKGYDPRIKVRELVGEGAEYVRGVYEDEVKKGSNSSGKATDSGLVKAKAGVTTGLVVSGDVFGALAGWLGRAVKTGKENASHT